MRLIVVGSIVVSACSFEPGSGVPGDRGPPTPDPGRPDSGIVIDAAGPPTDATVVPCTDTDADGICDAVDDWPCGIKPTEAAATVMWSQNSNQSQVTVKSVNLDATVRYAVASPQEMLNLKLELTIKDTACTQACVDQLEVGWISGNRLGCVFDAPVPESTGIARSINVNIAAPNPKGVYDLRVNLGQNYSCNYNGATSWWISTPGTAHTIAKLCVR